MLGLNKNITLVLHDWGGMIGMAYALDHMERIGRIVILNTAAFLPPHGKKIPIRLKIVRNLGFLSKLAVQGLNLFARSALIMASVKHLPGDVKSGLMAPYNCWQNRIAILQFVRDIPLIKTDPSYNLVAGVEKDLMIFRPVPHHIAARLIVPVFEV